MRDPEKQETESYSKSPFDVKVASCLPRRNI